MIIDRLTTLFDFKLDKKSLDQYAKHMNEVTRLTKRLAQTTKAAFKTAGFSADKNAVGQARLTRAIKNTSAAIGAEEALKHNARGAERSRHSLRLSELNLQLNRQKKALETLKEMKEAFDAMGRAASRGADKASLKTAQFNERLLRSKILVKGLATATRRAFKGMAHRISRTASVLIRFRNLMGVTIAGVIGYNEIKKITQSGLEVESTGLALANFGKPKGETKEQEAARVAATREDIRGVALRTTFGLKETEEAWLAFTRRGMDAKKFLEGFINSTAKYGGTVDDLKRATLQLGQGWSKNKLQGQDLKALLETKLPILKALIAVTGDANKSEDDNIANIYDMSRKGKLDREVLTKAFEFMKKDAEEFAIQQQGLVSFKLNQLGDFLEIFRREIADKGYFKAFGDVISDIAAKLTASLEDGSFAETALAISTFLANSLKSVWGWAQKVFAEFKAGAHWTQKLTKAFGGFSSMVKTIGLAGLVVWLSPLLHFLTIAIPAVSTLLGVFGPLIVAAGAAYAIFKLIKHNWQWIKDNGWAIGSALTAIGAALMIFARASIAAAIGKIVTGFKALAVLLYTNPMLAGLALLSGAILLIATNWDIVKEKATEALEYIDNKLRSAGIAQFLEGIGVFVARRVETNNVMGANPLTTDEDKLAYYNARRKGGEALDAYLRDRKQSNRIHLTPDVEGYATQGDITINIDAKDKTTGQVKQELVPFLSSLLGRDETTVTE